MVMLENRKIANGIHLPPAADKSAEEKRIMSQQGQEDTRKRNIEKENSGFLSQFCPSLLMRK
jgi:hypothetical protein